MSIRTDSSNCKTFVKESNFEEFIIKYLRSIRTNSPQRRSNGYVVVCVTIHGIIFQHVWAVSMVIAGICYILHPSAVRVSEAA